VPYRELVVNAPRRGQLVAICTNNCAISDLILLKKCSLLNRIAKSGTVIVLPSGLNCPNSVPIGISGEFSTGSKSTMQPELASTLNFLALGTSGGSLANRIFWVVGHFVQIAHYIFCLYLF
jgi:hypothetical protein